MRTFILALLGGLLLTSAGCQSQAPRPLPSRVEDEPDRAAAGAARGGGAELVHRGHARLEFSEKLVHCGTR